MNKMDKKKDNQKSGQIIAYFIDKFNQKLSKADDLEEFKKITYLRNLAIKDFLKKYSEIENEQLIKQVLTSVLGKEVNELFNFYINTIKRNSEKNKTISQITKSEQKKTKKRTASEISESVNRPLSDQKNTNNMNNPNINEARLTFKLALKTLQIEMSQNKWILELFPKYAQNDLLNLEIKTGEPPRGGIYDIKINEREVYFSEDLLSKFQTFWERNTFTDDEREIMCFLYYLHEFRHIEHKVDSDNYLLSKNSIYIFERLDYDADAFAVKNCFLIKSKNDSNWISLLSKILKIHIQGGEVFSRIDESGAADKIESGRFHRQLIWYFQYARLKSFSRETNFEDFHLEKEISFQVFRIDDTDNRTNYLGRSEISRQDMNHPLSLHIYFNKRRFDCTFDQVRITKFLSQGIFDQNVELIIEPFRHFFSENPQLTGREKQDSNQSIALVEEKNSPLERLEIEKQGKNYTAIFSYLYPNGPKDQEIWERAGGKSEKLDLTGNGEVQWFKAIKHIEKGGGIKMNNLIKEALKDFPDNKDLHDNKDLPE